MKAAFLLTLSAICASLQGCGSEHGSPVDVSGKITNGAEPVANAQVTFHSLNTEIPAVDRTKTAQTDAQGAYSISGLYPSEYMVRVEKPLPANQDPGMAPAESATDDPLAKFGADSPLRANVAEDKTTFDFDLASQ